MAEPAASIGSLPVITGLFENRASAERAFQTAVARGYEPADISVVMSDATRERDFSGNDAKQTDLSIKASQDSDKAAASAEPGGPTTGTLATLAPAVAAAGTLMLIPGLIFAGPVVIALAAAGAVGVAGGLIGVLARWGIPTSRVEEYERGIRDGGILLGIKPRNVADARYFEVQWRAGGGQQVHA